LGLEEFIASPIEIPADIQKLVMKREMARQSKDWSEADRIRRELEKSGWSVEDHPSGPKAVKI
ncbi:MAG: cysteine--tRNA ligase, partial [bacterium]|nr:cysteine--tRNA ligase [bacterium]